LFAALFTKTRVGDLVTFGSELLWAVSEASCDVRDRV